MENLPELSGKQQVFITLYLSGKSVFDAYREAGYEGEKPAAYMLKSRLEREIQELASAKGCSKADLMLQISSLNELPVVDKHGQPVQGISMSHKLKLLELQKKTLDMNKAELPKVTAIQINNYQGDSAKTNAVETTALPVQEADHPDRQ